MGDELEEYINRCIALDIPIVLDDTWYLDKRGDDIVLLKADMFTLYYSSNFSMNYNLKFKQGLVDECTNTITLPSCITMLASGCFARYDIMDNTITLDINNVSYIGSDVLEDIPYVSHLKCNNVTSFIFCPFRNMSNLRKIELEKIRSDEINLIDLDGLYDGCQIYLYDIHTTVSNLRRIIMRRMR